MALRQIEQSLRERLGGSLPGVEAQLRFAPLPRRTGWQVGHFPDDARVAAALVLVYPGADGVAVPLTVVTLVVEYILLVRRDSAAGR